LSLVASAWKSTTRTFHLGRNLGEDAIDSRERAIDRPHEHPAEQADHRHVRAIGGSHHGPAAAWRLGRKVRRLNNVRLCGQHAADFRAAVDMVAERDAIDSGSQQSPKLSRRNARPFGGVLPVGNHEVQPLAAAQTGDRCRDDPLARLADDVAN
jgi:hypothetical protein